MQTSLYHHILLWCRMDEMMCGRKGQKELELLRGKVDQSTSNGENSQKIEEDCGKDILSDEVCSLYFYLHRLART